MADSKRCSRCGASELVPRARVIDRTDSTRQDLELEVQRKPAAFLFKGGERSKVYATVCAECGHVELFAEMPQALYMAYLQADSNPAFSVAEELERTREALADSQIQLHQLEERLQFVEQLLERREPPKALPKPPAE